MAGDRGGDERAQLSFLPREGVDWSRLETTRRVWLEETRGDHAARMEFLAAQGLRLLMASPVPGVGGTLHFHNPRDGETLHLKAEGGRSLLPEAAPHFPAASRWMRMSRAAPEDLPPDVEASVFLDWEGNLLAVSAGRVHGVLEARMEYPGAILREVRAAEACRMLEACGEYEGPARALSCALACEEARGLRVPPAAAALRALLLETARVQSHLAWMEMAADCLGRRRTAAACRGLRGSLEEALSGWLGDPLGRGWVVPGGVREDFPLAGAAEAAASLREISRRWEELSGRVLALRAPRWMERRLSGLRDLAGDAALTGPLARALGMEVDARAEEAGAYGLLGWEMAVCGNGRVFGDLVRVKVREVGESLGVACRVLAWPPEPPLEARRGRGGRGEGFGRCEGPEGEVCCHLALEKGRVRWAAFSFPTEINRWGARLLVGLLLDEAELFYLPWRPATRRPEAGGEA